MGLFDDNASKKGEVRIGVSDENDESRLKGEVESKLDAAESSSSGGDVSLEDIHRQNEKIIELLEQIKSGSDSADVKNDQSSQNDVGGGMNELL